MTDLLLSMPFIFANEGGYTVDSGGPTMLGITQSTYSRFLGRKASIEDVRAITKKIATEVYRKFYWEEMCCGFMNAQNVATAVMDIGVNRGVGVGQLYVQKACNLLGSKIEVDGNIGPVTIKALNQKPAGLFIKQLEALEMAGYEAIVAMNPKKYKRYQKGWENRARRLLTLV